MTRRDLVLASASPARLRLLRASGFDPSVMPSGVSEDTETVETSQMVLALAQRKAAAVMPQAGEAIVIACDSMLDIAGRAIGKPATPRAAVEQWHAMRGGEGVLYTGHCVVDGVTGRSAGGTAATTVRFGKPTDDEIDAYVATGEPLGVAGGFTIDGRSAPFIDGVDGDPSNVLGLSLALFRRLLAELHIEITDLWI